MCIVFKRGLSLPCQACKGPTIHLLQKVLNCRKAKYECLLCGRVNGLRLLDVTDKKVQAV